MRQNDNEVLITMYTLSYSVNNVLNLTHDILSYSVNNVLNLTFDIRSGSLHRFLSGRLYLWWTFKLKSNIEGQNNLKVYVTL